MTTDPELRPFSDWLNDHAQGLVNDEMTAALAEVVANVSHLRKKGSLTLKINIEPVGSGGRTVSTSCVVTAKPPEADSEMSIFYVDSAGGLHRDDPFQTSFPDLQRVDQETGEIRTINEEN